MTSFRVKERFILISAQLSAKTSSSSSPHFQANVFNFLRFSGELLAKRFYWFFISKRWPPSAFTFHGRLRPTTLRKHHRRIGGFMSTILWQTEGFIMEIIFFWSFPVYLRLFRDNSQDNMSHFWSMETQMKCTKIKTVKKCFNSICAANAAQSSFKWHEAIKKCVDITQQNALINILAILWFFFFTKYIRTYFRFHVTILLQLGLIWTAKSHQIRNNCLFFIFFFFRNFQMTNYLHF